MSAIQVVLLLVLEIWSVGGGTVYPFETFENIWTPEQAKHLLELVQTRSPYLPTPEDNTAEVEHIGEGVPTNKGYRFSDPKLFLK